MRNMSRGNQNGNGQQKSQKKRGGDGEAEEAELLEGDEESGEPESLETQNFTEINAEFKVKKGKWHIEEGIFPIQQTKVYLFILDDPQWFIMFIFSHILFWVRYSTVLINAAPRRAATPAPRRTAPHCATPRAPRHATNAALCPCARRSTTGLGIPHI